MDSLISLYLGDKQLKFINTLIIYNMKINMLHKCKIYGTLKENVEIFIFPFLRKKKKKKELWDAWMTAFWNEYCVLYVVLKYM